MSRLESTELRVVPGINQISTRWALINHPMQFVIRYAPAIRKYFGALLKDPHDADEASQEFLLRAVKQGFPNAAPERGRFRDYLKVAVRNEALSYQRRHRDSNVSEVDLSQATAPGPEADQAWLADWQQCILAKTWRILESEESGSTGNLYYTVLRLTVEYPTEDSQQLATRMSALIGRPLRADAFRKQLSRARRLFAEVLIKEVAQTLKDPTPELIEEELSAVGLMKYVHDYLPGGWHSRGNASDLP